MINVPSPHVADTTPYHVLHRTGEAAVAVVLDDETVALVFGYPTNRSRPLGDVALHVQRRCVLADVFAATDCGCRDRLRSALDRFDRDDRPTPAVVIYVDRDDATVYDDVSTLLTRLGVAAVRLVDYTVAEAVALRERGWTIQHATDVAGVTAVEVTS